MPDKRRIRRYADADLHDVTDNPEWTEEDFARAKRGREVLPEAVLDGIEK
jgi:hypothetical protein